MTDLAPQAPPPLTRSRERKRAIASTVLLAIAVLVLLAQFAVYVDYAAAILSRQKRAIGGWVASAL